MRRAVILSDESSSTANEIAQKAFSLMQAKGFAPTPKCYALWYAYFSDADPELQQVLEKVVDGRELLTERRVLELYSQFFEVDMETEALRQTGALIEASVARVLARLNDAKDSAVHYGRSLDNFTGQLTGGLKPRELQQIVGAVISETSKMRERNEQIAGDIHESSIEIIELRRSLESVRREAHTDALTGIANRRSFDERLKLAIREAKSSSDTLSLLMIDIDHFKKFNDSFGHQLGDKVLQLVARILKTSIKGRDTVARYGGEEFAVILPSTRLAGAATLGDQIREAVASRRIIQKRTGEDFGSITLSVGVSSLRSADSGESLIKRADDALYSAKRGGRNRVITEDQLGRPVAV
jgi:diguanylate cyclase